MLTNNNNCSTPAQNIIYNSEACFDGQGRSLQNLTNIGASGIGLFHGKFNDIAGLFNLDATDASIVLTPDNINKVINFGVQISASPGNALSLNPDGLYATGGGGPTPAWSAVLAAGATSAGSDPIISAGDQLVVLDATASRIAAIGASQELTFLDTATYPSLAEIAFVKGVTSAIQTQIDAKLTDSDAAVGARINASANATPNDTDFVATAESAGSLKKITWTNVKAFLKTFFDTLYTPTNQAAVGITLHANGNNAFSLTSIAAAEAFLAGLNRNITRFDLTGYTSMKIIGRVTTAGSPAGNLRLRVKYDLVSGGFSTTVADYTNIGTGGSEIAISLKTTGVIDSGWIALDTTAKADVYLGAFQIDGDGTAASTVAMGSLIIYAR